MFEKTLIRQCAPTLAGIKTGNLFTVFYDEESELIAEACKLNRIFVPKGLRAVPICCGNRRALIYVYRPENLGKDLEDESAKHLLCKMRYPCENANRCVAHLIKKLQQNDKGTGEMANDIEFPHEIGLFLGYPPEDVCGFIDNNAHNCKCCGCWKVYGDVEQAQMRFTQYKKCTENYYEKWLAGYSIDELTVAS